jgi:hypothetical protein
MSISRVLTLCVFVLLQGFAASAFAHEGHGLEGLHMHPSDLWGFAVFGFVVVLTAWLGFKKQAVRT